MISKDNLNILLIDDSPFDTRLIREVLKEIDLKCEVHSVSTGKEALNYLNNQGKDKLVTPDLILLELILPDINGMEILNQIKNDSKLELVPVIIVSMSQDQRNMDEAYKNHVNAYVVKPVTYADLKSALRCVMALYCTK